MMASSWMQIASAILFCCGIGGPAIAFSPLE
ncbi:uncharacterized protein METZ01_LOCUS427364 [marine metagenome]|uniref:Uncharacterized protein n=1 Tax=marine metagenome TaxID=408172 RepID=A0A382XUJ5_9ZZZZ